MTELQSGWIAIGDYYCRQAGFLAASGIFYQTGQTERKDKQISHIDNQIAGASVAEEIFGESVNEVLGERVVEADRKKVLPERGFEEMRVPDELGVLDGVLHVGAGIPERIAVI